MPMVVSGRSSAAAPNTQMNKMAQVAFLRSIGALDSNSNFVICFSDVDVRRRQARFYADVDPRCQRVMPLPAWRAPQSQLCTPVITMHPSHTPSEQHMHTAFLHMRAPSWLPFMDRHAGGCVSSDLDLMTAQAGGADDDGGKRGSLGPSRVAATFVPVFQSISTQATSKKFIFSPCFCFLLSMVIT